MGQCRVHTEAGSGWTDATAGSAPGSGQGSIPASTPASTPAGSRRAMLRHLFVFACVGGVFNVVYGLLYVVLREGLNAQWANAAALVLSTIAGTFGHRRVTFGVRSSEGHLGHQVLGLLLLVFSLVVTAGCLQLLDVGVADPPRWAELAVLAAANLGVGLVRFFAFRWAMVPTGEAG